MSAEKCDQKPDNERSKAFGVFDAVMDMLSMGELLSYAVVGLFRAIGFVLGGLLRFLP